MYTENIKIMSVGLLLLMLTNCSTLYQSSNQNQFNTQSLPSGLSEINLQGKTLKTIGSIDGWQRLIEIGPGSDAIITFLDGSLRGGTIVQVSSDTIILNTAGNNLTILRSEIVSVEIKGSSGALAGGLVGFLISGVGLTAMLCAGEDCPPEGWLLGISLLGLPGGLLGALIGSQIGGDEIIVP